MSRRPCPRTHSVSKRHESTYPDFLRKSVIQKTYNSRNGEKCSSLLKEAKNRIETTRVGCLHRVLKLSRHSKRPATVHTFLGQGGFVNFSWEASDYRWEWINPFYRGPSSVQQIPNNTKAIQKNEHSQIRPWLLGTRKVYEYDTICLPWSRNLMYTRRFSL